MINKKRIIYLILVLSLGFAVVFGYKLNKKIEWLIAKDVIASGGFPAPIGINHPVQFNCFKVGETNPKCTGLGKADVLCSTLSVSEGAGRFCELYSAEIGIQAGGVSDSVLLSNQAIAQAGINPSGGLIAGCVSPVLCDNGPVGGPGGCYNCFARASWTEEIKTKAKYFFKYMIAGWKE